MSGILIKHNDDANDSGKDHEQLQGRKDLYEVEFLCASLSTSKRLLLKLWTRKLVQSNSTLLGGRGRL